MQDAEPQFLLLSVRDEFTLVEELLTVVGVDESFEDVFQSLGDRVSRSCVALAEFLVRLHHLGISLAALACCHPLHIGSHLDEVTINLVDALHKEVDVCVFAELEHSLYLSTCALNFLSIRAHQILLESLHCLLG